MYLSLVGTKPNEGAIFRFGNYGVETVRYLYGPEFPDRMHEIRANMTSHILAQSNYDIEFEEEKYDPRRCHAIIGLDELLQRPQNITATELFDLMASPQICQEDYSVYQTLMIPALSSQTTNLIQCESENLDSSGKYYILECWLKSRLDFEYARCR